MQLVHGGSYALGRNQTLAPSSPVEHCASVREDSLFPITGSPRGCPSFPYEAHLRPKFLRPGRVQRFWPAALAIRSAETVLLPFSDPCLLVQPPSIGSHLGHEPVRDQPS